MPLAGPAIATVSILTFLPAWNSYLWPLMVVQTESLRPAMVGIDYFKQLNVSWGQIMAYASMITCPYWSCSSPSSGRSSTRSHRRE